MNDSVQFAYVGCRTNAARRARGKGISVFRIKDNDWEFVQLVQADDPSFLAFDRKQKYLYAAQGDGSEVAAFARDVVTGELKELGRWPSHGRNGVHVMTDPTDRYLVVVNYLTVGDICSNLAVLPIKPDGTLAEASDVCMISGETGPNKHEQQSAKPHHIKFSPNGNFLVMADKGLDEVRVFRLDALGKLHSLPGATVRLRWGCGPRHLRFHPALPYLYILNELDSTIVSATFDAATGRIQPFQVIPSQSDVYTQIHRASEIDVSPDGRFVYASNRGQNTIGVFAIAADGRLHPIQFADAGGKVPRHFAFASDGRHLYVANEFSDSIVQFAIAEDGKLTQMGTVASTGTPTCIVLT